MVLVNMGGHHHVDVIRALPGEVLCQREPPGVAVLVFLRLSAAAVNHHNKRAARKSRIRALQNHGFSVAHVDECQSYLFHRRQPMARLM